MPTAAKLIWEPSSRARTQPRLCDDWGFTTAPLPAGEVAVAMWLPRSQGGVLSLTMVAVVLLAVPGWLLLRDVSTPAPTALTSFQGVSARPSPALVHPSTAQPQCALPTVHWSAPIADGLVRGFATEAVAFLVGLSAQGLNATLVSSMVDGNFVAELSSRRVSFFHRERHSRLFACLMLTCLFRRSGTSSGRCGTSAMEALTPGILLTGE